MEDCRAVECAGIGMAAVECLLGHEQKACGRESEAEIVVEEEVVEHIRTYEIFGLLLDISVFVGRNQFGTYRCVDDVEECGATLLIHIIRSYIADEMADECLGYAGINALH